MSVSQRTLRCQKYYDERELIRAVRGGTEVLRKAGTKYLPKEPGESAESYRRRLARSFLANYTDKTARNLASKPFSRPIVVKSERYQELADEYVKAVDRKGTNLTGLCSTVFEDALWNGSSFMAVDCGLEGGRPYAYHLSGDHILGYRLDEDDRLTEIRIQERAVVDDGEWGEKEVCRVRVFRRAGEVVTWSLYEEDGTAIVHDQAFALKEIPVVPVHSSAVVASGELFAQPPLKDLAYMNVEHYLNSSDQANILRVARIPILFASGIPNDSDLTVGIEYAIKSSEIGADIKYVEHSGAAIESGRNALKDIEAKMQSYGLDMLENTGPVETATGRSLRAGETNNRIALITLNLASATEKVLGLIAYFNKVAEPDFQVDINTDYGITSNPDELSALANARTMGDLSREDYLQEMKRRDILRKDFSLTDNEDRLSVELA